MDSVGKHPLAAEMSRPVCRLKRCEKGSRVSPLSEALSAAMPEYVLRNR